MKKFLLFLIAFFALGIQAQATDIDIGASSIVGFNSADAGSDTALSNVTVNLGSPSVTCSNCLPAGAVGIGGMQVTLGGVRYEIASVASRSAFTLATNYGGSSGTTSGTLHKFVVLRIYVTQPFIPSGSTTVVQSGTAGSSTVYRKYGVSLVNDGAQTVGYLPQINDLPATTDSSNPAAAYISGLYTPSGSLIQSYPRCVSTWRLSHLTNPTSWAQICQFNSQPVTPPPNPTTYLSEQQINARFPSCLINNLDFFAATGNVKNCLTLNASDFSISGGVLSSLNVTKQLQEEGSDLPIRSKINFVGSSYTATDAGTRTDIIADSDLNALASIATSGCYARTGTGTSATRTITGTANEIAVANGDCVSNNPTISLPSALTFTGKTVTGGVYGGITGFGIRSTGGGAFDLQFANTETLTGIRTVTFTVNDGNRTINLGGNFTTSGANPLTFTTTGSTNVTLPLSGVVVARDTTDTLTNKTATDLRVGGAIRDTNGNEVIETPATSSAVNQLRVTNSATGTPVQVSAVGDDSIIDLLLNGKGATGKVAVGTYGASPVAGVIGGPDASGTNTGGANIIVHGGKGTGNAVPGTVVVQYPLIGATGTTLQSLSSNSYPVVTNLYSNVSGGSISNTASETSIFTGATGAAGSTRTIEAGISRAGTVYRVFAFGNINTSGTPTLQMRVKLGSTTIADTGAVTLVNNTAGRFFLTFDIVVAAIGAGGNVNCFPHFEYAAAGSGAVTQQDIVTAAQTAIDFTAAQTIDITFQWGTASASNNISLFGVTIDRHR